MPSFIHCYVLLVHEKVDCVFDLIINIISLDQNAFILIYDGSADTSIASRITLDYPNVEVVPQPRPMKWGRLHGYLVDCVDYLGDRDYDALTIIDSDQMMIRADYTLELSKSGITRSTVFSPMPGKFDTSHSMTPVASAHLEVNLWEPFMRRFDAGMRYFVHWTFWPGTVIGADIARKIVFTLKGQQLNKILLSSKIWATEEILIPTLAMALGGKVEQNPFSPNWNKFQAEWNHNDLNEALREPTAFYIHPVKRLIDDPLRTLIRSLYT